MNTLNQLPEDYHQFLYPVAMNLLNNAEDAEDLIQETILKWLSMDQPELDNPRGYLVRMLINKSLNFLRDKKRHEAKLEVAIAPELLVDHIPQLIEKGPSLSLSLLKMLEKLNALERAVFLLKEIFSYSHKEIAEMLGISEENSRQILARAKKRLQADKSRFSVDPTHHHELVQTFVEVCQGQDLEKLLKLLQKDIKLHQQGSTETISNAYQVASQLLNWSDKITDYMWICQENTPLLLAFEGQVCAAVLKLIWINNKLVQIWIMKPQAILQQA